MKLTIDIPAPTHQLELISRLRQKIRNYKTSMKQLQRAHYITKDLLRRAQERNNDEILQARYDALEDAYNILQDENRYLRKRVTEAESVYDNLPMPAMDATFTDTNPGLRTGPNGAGNGVYYKGGNGQA